MTLATPSTALLQAWASVLPQARALLDLFLDAPAVVVEDLDASVASRLACAPIQRIKSSTSM
jgi:hypothetical protein